MIACACVLNRTTWRHRLPNFHKKEEALGEEKLADSTAVYSLCLTLSRGIVERGTVWKETFRC